MPASPFGGFGETHQFVVHDDMGEVVLALNDQTFTVFDSQQQPTVYHRDQGIQLTDGVIWTRQMLRGNQPVYVTVCGTCRNPPVSFINFQRVTHGILSVRNARTCMSCGRIVCSRHRRLIDGKWFCLGCARTEKMKRLIRPIFFREVE